MDEELSYITNNLKMYRARMAYTQEDMAKIMGISRKTYINYESKPQRLNIETLQRIADILKCKLSDFFVQYNVTDSNIKEE